MLIAAAGKNDIGVADFTCERITKHMKYIIKKIKKRNTQCLLIKIFTTKLFISKDSM